MVKSDLQPPAFDVRHSIDQVLLEQPGRKRWRRKSPIPSRYAKKENFLPRREDSRAENVWKNFPEPRTASEHELSCGNPLTLVRGSVFQAACLSRIYCLREAVLRSKPNGIFDYSGHRASGHQDTALGLKDAALNAVKPNLWIPLFKRSVVQLLKWYSASR
jgi:hypothetical protein